MLIELIITAIIITFLGVIFGYKVLTSDSDKPTIWHYLFGIVGITAMLIGLTGMIWLISK